LLLLAMFAKAATLPPHAKQNTAAGSAAAAAASADTFKAQPAVSVNGSSAAQVVRLLSVS
jgi:hypothetical protein